MLLDKLRRVHRTLAFRLTVWYAGIFTASSILAFAFFYFQITSIVRERTDQDLLEEIEEFSRRLTTGGIDVLKDYMEQEAKDEGKNKVLFRLLMPNGKELASSDASAWGALGPSRPALEQITNGASHALETVSLPERRHKVRVLYGPIGSGLILQMAWSLEDDEEFVAEFREIFGGTLAVVMALAALFGWFMAKHALKNVEEVTRTARRISASDLEQRVPVKGQADEIDRLAVTFNDMLDRIQTLVIEMKEMNENIAHDLRSPITRIRGLAEMTLAAGKTIDEYEAIAASTIEDCDRLLEMINTMLYISEAEAGAGKLKAEPIEMERVVRDACELFQPMADEKGVKLVAQIDGKLKVRGDRQAMQRMVANLIDNAINYTAPPGTVTVSVNGDEKLGIISVKDTGIGISPKDLPHIFKRFYRCDRSRSELGNGLGLSLVKAIVHCHRGYITVNSKPDVGTTFTVALPRASDAS